MDIRKNWTCLTSYPPQWRCERCGRVFPDSFPDRDMHVCEPKPVPKPKEEPENG